MAKGKVTIAILGFLAASIFYGEQINYYYGELVAFLRENFDSMVYWLATTYLYGYPLLLLVLFGVVVACIVALIYLATSRREVI